MALIEKSWWPEQKPLPGCQIRRGHPLAQGLIACALLNEGGGIQGIDLVANRPANQQGSGIGSWGPGRKYSPAWKVTGGTGGTYIQWPNQAAFDSNIISFVVGIQAGATQTGFAGLVVIADSAGYHASWQLTGDATALDFYTNGGGANASGVTVANLQNQPHITALVLNNGSFRSFVDGLLKSSGTYTVGATVTGKQLRVAAERSATPISIAGDYYFCYVYNRALQDSEVLQLSIAPFQIFTRPEYRLIPLPAAPAAGYPAAYYDRYQLGQNPGVM